MKLRIRRDVRGSFLGIVAGTDSISVHRGDTIDCPEPFALQLLMNGEAETNLSGHLGRRGELPPPKEIARLRAQLAELQPPDIRDQLRDRSKLNPVEREALMRRAMNL
jgi:hypothetical protein